MEIPEFRTREEFENFVNGLKVGDINRLTLDEWLRLYDKIFKLIDRRFKRNIKIFIKQEAEPLKKLYTNYRPDPKDIAHTQTLASKLVKNILQKHPGFKQEIIDFPSYDNEKKARFLKKLNRTLHRNAYAVNPIRRLFAPTLIFAPALNPFNKGKYVPSHRIYISDRQYLGEISTLSHEFYHSSQGYSKHEKIIRWLGGRSNIHLPKYMKLFKANQILYLNPDIDDKAYRFQPIEKFPYMFEQAFAQAVTKEIGAENLIYNRLFTATEQIADSFGIKDKIRRIYIHDGALQADFNTKKIQDIPEIKAIKHSGLPVSFINSREYVTCVFGKAGPKLLEQMEKPLKECQMNRYAMQLYGVLKCVLRDCGLKANSDIRLPVFSITPKQITPALQAYLQKLSPDQAKTTKETIDFNLNNTRSADCLSEHFFEKNLLAMGIKKHRFKVKSDKGKTSLRLFTSDPAAVKFLQELGAHGRIVNKNHFYAVEFDTAKVINGFNSGKIKFPEQSRFWKPAKERT